MSPTSFVFVSGLAGVLMVTATPVAAADPNAAWNALLNGERLYLSRCMGCHGQDLKGLKTGPNLLTSPKSDDRTAFTRSLLEGKGRHAVFENDATVADGANCQTK